MMTKGVSVIICCHNSEKRIGQTLKHLSKQIVPKEIAWEVVIVDNGSTDNTLQVVKDSWPKYLFNRMRIIHEPKLGVAHARFTGCENSRYEYLSFVDDDNWVCSDWIKITHDIFTEYPNVAICGGLSQGVFEIEPPPWFEKRKGDFAIGKQSIKTGDITAGKGFVWTAGSILRKRAWEQLLTRGFYFLLSGRKGKELTCGEDVELCFALRLLGWHIRYDERLLMKHYMPANRLEWVYVSWVIRAIGAAEVTLDLYRRIYYDKTNTWKKRFIFSWSYRLIRTLLRLCRPKLLFYKRLAEGDQALVTIEWNIGFLIELLRKRKDYHHILDRVEEFKAYNT